MSLPDKNRNKNRSEKRNKKGIDKQILVFVGITCLLIFLAVYYAGHREPNDAYNLAGRALDASGDVSSYQFDIHSNISMLGESFTLIRGNGSVDYSNERMAVRLRSVDDPIDLVIVDGTSYFRSGDSSWETRKLNREIWDSYDQLTRKNLLLANSTNLSMERTDSYFLTAFPDTDALITEAEKAGLHLKGDEQMNEYRIKYLIERESYRISSIDSRMEFMMNVQGLMSPVTINNRVDVYGYDMVMEIEAPEIRDE